MVVKFILLLLLLLLLLFLGAKEKITSELYVPVHKCGSYHYKDCVQLLITGCVQVHLAVKMVYM